jgi:type IV secretion system protein VirB11
MLPGVRPLLNYLAPIESDIADPLVTEIVINQPAEVGIERAGIWSWRTIPEFTYDRLDQIAILAAFLTGRDVGPDSPFCGTTLPGGQRVHIARPPATKVGNYAMCIRNPPKKKPSMDDPGRAEMFAETNAVKGLLPQDVALLDLYLSRNFPAFLKASVKAGKTIAACGITGSGKTQLLRTLIDHADEEERLVTVESDEEFGDVGPHNKAAFFYNPNRPGQRAQDAVEAALRFYPRTLAFQEVRGAEAFALVTAIGTGHRSFTSWHAEAGKEIHQMVRYLRLHPSHASTPDEELREIVKSSFDIIVSCVKDTSRPDPYYIPRIWFRDAERKQP